ncbi:MAG: CHASE2 domain-containing protein [Cyanobacteria bacterium P01_F01_bin.150]
MAENRVVVLKLEGDLKNNGFAVTLEVATESPLAPITFPELAKRGALPPNPKLANSLKQWQQGYTALTQPSRSARALTPYKVQTSGSINPLIDICQSASEELDQLFQEWLHTESFLDLEGVLRGAVDPLSTVRVLVQTSEDELHSLPWNQWSFIKDYGNAEIAMGASEFKGNASTKAVRAINDKVNILAVLGSDEHIDLKADQHVLKSLPGANIDFLHQPSRQEFHEKLYEQGWDILFFAGHSDTVDGEGIIQLNPSTALTIKQVENAVKKAIANGLQIAIFNSCKGLGLAHALTQLQLPQIIVMREVLPDYVAHRFLKAFLTAFADGLPFYQAEREAREQLQGMEDEFPCASWLPLIYQHPAKVPPSWQELQYPSQQPPSLPATSPPLSLHQISRRKKITTMAIASILVAGLVVGMRTLGILQGLELKAYDQIVLAQPKLLPPDQRFIIIGIDEQDIQFQDNQGLDRIDSLADSALETLLQKISPYNPKLIGLDIIRDRPLSVQTVKQLEKQKFIGICQQKGRNLDSVPPPDNISPEYIGFNSFPGDKDGVIRRQFLGNGGGNLICPVHESFSFRVAQIYLQNTHNIKLEWVLHPFEEKRSHIRLGKHTFKRLESNSGGYQLAEGETNGYQVLINYRRSEPQIVHLRNILSGAMDTQLKQLITNKIILIGVVDERDHSATPYSRGLDSVPGVIIHAQMASQVIDAALGDKPLLAWWSEWAEILWITGWSFIGAGIIVSLRSPRIIVLSILIGSSILWGLSFFLFIRGWWIPFIPALISLLLAGLCIIILPKSYWSN